MKTFGWDLCYDCNYRCPYCGIWENSSDDDMILSVDDWKNIWDRIYDLYGSCRIFMSGGEPSVYPGFYDLVDILAQKHHPDICTNLSWNVEKVVNHIPPENLTISPTFHPTFAKFSDFFKKALRIRDYLPDNQIYYVAYPGQIDKMPARSKKFKDAGISLVPLPLRGEGYMINSEEEKKIIREVSPYEGSEKIDYQLQDTSPRGKKCRAGMDYAMIRVDGNVDRCSQCRSGEVGRIDSADFRLFKAPEECEKEYCPIESNWIIE